MLRLSGSKSNYEGVKEMKIRSEKYSPGSKLTPGKCQHYFI